MRWSELIRIVESHGYKLAETGKGSHMKYKNKEGDTVVIPVHGSKEAGTVIAHKILKQVKKH